LEAEIITETQRRNEKAERCHVKARMRRLGKLGIDLPSLRCCIMDHLAL
jgi:hypothetical protein